MIPLWQALCRLPPQEARAGIASAATRRRPTTRVGCSPSCGFTYPTTRRPDRQSPAAPGPVGARWPEFECGGDFDATPAPTLPPRRRAPRAWRGCCTQRHNPQGGELRLKQEFFLVSAILQEVARAPSGERPLVQGAVRPRRDPAQRHAPRARDPRADASPGRRHRARVGSRVEHHAASSPSTNHTLLPKALEIWPVDLIDRCCRGIADHLPDQSGVPRRYMPRYPMTTSGVLSCP